MPLKHCLVFLPLLMVAPGVNAQPILIRASDGPESAITQVRTFRGVAPVRSTPVAPASAVVFALATDYLNKEQLASAKQSILAFYAASKGKLPIRLAILNPGLAGVAGPIRTRPQLLAALREVALSDNGAPPDTASSSHFYSTLGENLRALGGGWPAVVLVGDFPELSSDISTYAAALLSTQLSANRQRLAIWNLGSNVPGHLAAAASQSSGYTIHSEPTEILANLNSEEPAMMELDWDRPALTRGFHQFELQLLNSGGLNQRSLAVIAQSAGFPLPDLEHYAAAIAHLAAARTALAQQTFTDADASTAKTHLEAALEVNPRDAAALRESIDLNDRLKDFRAAAAYTHQLAELQPMDGKLMAALGHRCFLAGDFEGAERAHLRARELDWKPAESTAELGLVYLARNDPGGAMPMFDESLAAEPANQSLWFARADACLKLGDWSRQTESLEKGVTLGGSVSERRTALVRLLLDHQQSQRVAAQVESGLRELPPRADPQVVWAGFLEELKRPAEALKLWRGASKLAENREDIRYAIARLLFASGDMPAARSEAEAGLAAAPDSARIFLIKARADEAQGQFLEARQEIRRFLPRTKNVELLRHAADVEDLYGRDAPSAYQKLAEVDSSPGVLQRGIKVALREGDLQRADWFAQRLQAKGFKQAAELAKPGEARIRNEVLLPGGRDALLFMARGRGGSSPDHFFVDYAKAIRQSHPRMNAKAGQEFAAMLHDYFQRLQELCQLGQTSKGSQQTTQIVLSATDKKQRKQTERALSLLGWKVRTNKGEVAIELGEKASQSRKQDLASALGIDQVGMQEAFSAGKPYTIEIPWDRVPIILDEETWRKEFYGKERPFGGLAEVMGRDMNMARVYAGFSVLDRETAVVMAQGIGLGVLAQRYSEQVAAHASSLAIEKRAADVPGGATAIEAWARLAGADPRDPGRFFRALFEKNDGDLLAYYSTLAGLDLEHQRFFTRTPTRLSKFYDQYRESPDNARASGTIIRETSFGEFLRKVPLDKDGSVVFPGSPELWMVIKGKAGSVGNTGKLLKKIHKKAAPDVEDEILLRLGSTRYTADKTSRSELQNFLAVVRVEEHRDDALDEESALLLAQHSAHYAGYYPYFATFTKLSSREYAQFFQFAEKANTLHGDEANTLLGHFHALMEILRIAVINHAVDQAKATELFGKICERFARITTADQISLASVEAISSLVTAGESADPGAALRDLLIGRAPKAEWSFGEVPRSIDVTAARTAAWERVLELQKAPSLTAVLAIANAAVNLAKNPAPQVAVMESNLARLPSVGVEKGTKLEGKEKDHIQRFLPDKLGKAIAEAHQKIAKGKKTNPKELQRLSMDVLSELEPHIRLALGGILYAYCFRPTDILLANDPLVLRRHRVVNYESQTKGDFFAQTELVSGATGSFVSGSFVTLATVAGQSSAADMKAAEGHGEMLASEQLGAIRLTNWPEFRVEDQRRAGLRLRAAREWIVESATDADSRAWLSAETAGYLSPSRRHDLLNALSTHEWREVWSAITLGDLYSLGERLEGRLQPSTSGSPVFAALYELSKKDDGARLNLLGPNMPAINGCMHPHLASQMPYEEFERYMFPNRVAERTAEFKLYLAEYMERAGIPPSFLPIIAEPAARRVFASMKMADFRDWAAALSAFAKFDDAMMEGALDNQ